MSFINLKHISAKVIISILSFILFIPIGFLLFLGIIFTNVGENKVIETINSPNELYSATVISSDQGAPGRDTWVEVQENRQINLCIGTLSKKSKRIWSGDRGESPTIVWKDDTTLDINDYSYSIKTPLSLKNRFSQKMGIYIPDREPNYFEDTHGGFHGDGDLIACYYLREDEKDALNIDIIENSYWNKIDDTSYQYLFGGIEGSFSKGFTQSFVPITKNGYFCFWDNQTKTHEFPSEASYSYNYIIALYNEDSECFHIYKLDT